MNDAHVTQMLLSSHSDIESMRCRWKLRPKASPYAWFVVTANLLLALLFVHLYATKGPARGPTNYHHLQRQPRVDASSPSTCRKYVKPIPTVMSRNELGSLLQNEEGMFVGVELGVQVGLFAETTLRQWTKCRKYYLVDLWAHQTNYHDEANVENSEHEDHYQQARKRLQQFQDRGISLEYLRMYTSDAAAHFENETLDFVYVDARHDYCGAMEDLELFWHKLREGGVLAGHDYVEPDVWRAGQDWSICQDGTRKELAVVGAVNDFARKYNLQVVPTPVRRETEWNSWMIRKPEGNCI